MLVPFYRVFICATTLIIICTRYVAVVGVSFDLLKATMTEIVHLGESPLPGINSSLRFMSFHLIP